MPVRPTYTNVRFEGAGIRRDIRSTQPTKMQPLLPANPLFRYDASTLTGLYQDTAGTTPVTSDLDPVGRWLPIEAQGSNRVQPLSGLGVYYASTSYGPAVEPKVFREQVGGSGGGAVPPPEEEHRFMYAVVSAAELTDVHMVIGYGSDNSNLCWRMGCSTTDWYLFKDSNNSTPDPEKISIKQARTVPRGILMSWYDGAAMYLQVNGETPLSTTCANLDTNSSDSNQIYGWHIAHQLTSSGYSGPTASELYNMHETACYDYVPSSAARAALFSHLNSKWLGIGDVT